MPKKVFKKGHTKKRGRPAGVPNKVPTLLKDCIIRAAEIVGENGKGKGQLTGFLVRIFKKDLKSASGLLRAVLPLHITGTINHRRVFETKEELMEELKARGLPTSRVFPDAVPPPRQLPPPLTIVKK